MGPLIGVPKIRRPPLLAPLGNSHEPWTNGAQLGLMGTMLRRNELMRGQIGGWGNNRHGRVFGSVLEMGMYRDIEGDLEDSGVYRQ